jgi:hypothetical protein
MPPHVEEPDGSPAWEEVTDLFRSVDRELALGVDARNDSLMLWSKSCCTVWLLGEAGHHLP